MVVGAEVGAAVGGVVGGGVVGGGVVGGGVVGGGVVGGGVVGGGGVDPAGGVAVQVKEDDPETPPQRIPPVAVSTPVPLAPPAVTVPVSVYCGHVAVFRSVKISSRPLVLNVRVKSPLRPPITKPNV